VIRVIMTEDTSMPQMYFLLSSAAFCSDAESLPYKLRPIIELVRDITPASTDIRTRKKFMS